MNNKKMIALILVLVLLLGGAYALYSKLSTTNAPSQIATEPPAATGDGEGTEPPRTPAPDFTVYDGDGNPRKLSEFRGKPVVLNFWSSNCGPCRQEMPDFQKVYEEMGDQVHFMMVNVTDGSWDTRESAGKFIEEHGFTFPVFYDTDVNAASVYAIRSLPTTFFIDKDGYAAAYSRGMIQMETLRQGISMITGK